MTEKKTFCSQCKMSKYADTYLGRRLRCAKWKELCGEKYLPVLCKAAIDCPEFVPERREDNLRSTSAYRRIVQRLTKEGILP